MSGFWALVTAFVLGLVISESSELSPWLAQKLIRWAARVRYPTRVEELSALIAERPGKLFKLVTASCFACAALIYRVTHRKTVPVHSATSRFWIGFGSALVAGALLTGELLLANVITNGRLIFSDPIIVGASGTFITAAGLRVATSSSARWAAMSAFALLLVSEVMFGFAHFSLDMGGMVVAAGVSAACTIRLGNRLRFPVMAASSTILGSSLLALSMILSVTSASNYYHLVRLLGLWFAFGLSAGVGVLLYRVLCDRLLSQSSSERVPHTAT